MQYALVAAAVGVAAGYATGGRLRHLGLQPLRWWGVLVGGAAVQLFAPSSVLVVVSLLCLLAFCLANVRLVGMTVVAVGLALNTLVIAANGAMPVRPAALVRAGVVDRGERVADLDLGSKRRLERPEDRLKGLGDILPVRPLRQVVSFGDLIVAVGVADVVAHLMHRRRTRPRAEAPYDGG